MTSTTIPQTDSGVRCGNCKGRHENSQAVRACYNGATLRQQRATEAANEAVRFPAADPVSSQKQRDFITRLREERGQPASVMGLDHLSKREASRMIEELLAMPKAAPPSHPDSQAGPVTEGMHKVGDAIFKVQRGRNQNDDHGGKATGHLYAKRLCPGDGYGSKATFIYAPGALKLLSVATKMTLEEAKAFGALYGTCCVCGRTLTDEKSIAAGIGPVCAGKGMWA